MHKSYRTALDSFRREVSVCLKGETGVYGVVQRCTIGSSLGQQIVSDVRTSEELRASCRQQLLLYPSPRHQQHGKPTS